MKLLFKVFILQTAISAFLAVPIYFYLRSDYQDFVTKQEIARSVPSGIGALCSDSWRSFSTGSGTCSHHGGVKYWGSYLRHIASTTWSGENLAVFIFLGIGLVGWYGFGTRFIHLKVKSELEPAIPKLKNCCIESVEKGFAYCFLCGAPVIQEPESSPAIMLASGAYVLLTTTFFALVALSVFTVIYSTAPASSNVANTSEPTPAANLPVLSSSPVAAPESSPTPAPTATPKPKPIVQTLINESDVLAPGYGKTEDVRVYRFHLSKNAHVKGSFNAKGNVSVEIEGYYSSNGSISADSIDIPLPAGTYELKVTSREIVTVTVSLTANYEP